jgi:hypothetical protein
VTLVPLATLGHGPNLLPHRAIRWAVLMDQAERFARAIGPRELPAQHRSPWPTAQRGQFALGEPLLHRGA